MPRARILVTVKTYPTLSKKYGETVCTAGVREDGSWVRLYPVPFRRLNEKERYRKYEWVECDIEKRDSDPRPESYIPIDHRQLVAVEHMGTGSNWRARRKLLLGTAAVYTSLRELIAAAKANEASLAVFKPRQIDSFQWSPEEREWDPEKIDEMRRQSQQGELFDAEAWRKTFQLIPKLPYSFSYRFRDAEGRSSEMQILDWEIGALYWNCLKYADGDESVALSKVRQKYWEEFLQTDLHFFLGTTQQFHTFAPNPWLIVGLFPVPHETQLELL